MDAARHILVADDDADMRLYLRSCLHSLGAAQVVEAADGLEALHLARALVPDLVISDLVMPGLDGLALCRALRADAALAAIPVLLISGETSQIPRAGRAPPEGLDGFDGFLTKPFNAAGLHAAVERLLALRP